ncbi:hypothetical protein ACFC1T_05300 [Kitasatospora sp. NPDC056076]|uniref:hypothetical protein n=1 Tax=Kitasatospora sp. NPDC056076 TaxID=3345703 RepID=UPI0035E1E955
MTTAIDAPVIPFGARAERTPYTVDVDGSTFRFDPERQVNITTAGGLLARTAMAGSCTNTNWDSKNDDTADPYVVG